MDESRRDARGKLLDVALSVIRTKGYAASTVDGLCAEAGVTKGAFFHYFNTKEELGVAAAEYWSELTGRLFASAPYHQHADALDRLLAYIEFRKALLRGELPEYTCLVGTMVQETYDSSPAIRAACARSICGHAATLEADIAAAMRSDRAGDFGFTPQSLALYTQAVIQGAFVLAKATQSRQIAVDCIDHLLRYFKTLFHTRSAR